MPDVEIPVSRCGAACRLMGAVGRARRARVAAAVCCRWEDGALRLCLISTSDGERWTFPKGHRKRGETLPDAAAREAHEEAGVLGVVDPRRLDAYRYPSRRAVDDLVAAFLLHVTGVTVPQEAFRAQLWCDPQIARLRLAEGRDRFHAAELDRVLDRAIRVADASRRRTLAGGSSPTTGS